MKPKRCVIIYAHPRPNSFNHAVLEVVSAELRAADVPFTVRDLYAGPFDPLIRPGHPKIEKDVQGEQAAIKEADLVVVVCPVWWFNVPAICMHTAIAISITTARSH
jgi:NAD(P)H dehydrogenase (quinone)